MSTSICLNASIYFVPGLGGTDPSFFTPYFTQIVETIFGLEYKPAVMKILKNKCRYGLKSDNLLKNEIKAICTNHKSCVNQVNLVWFCHSYGAKILREAYEELKATSMDYEILRVSTATICIGGVSMTTESFAQVCLNVEYKNDQIARGGSVVLGKREENVFRIGPLRNGLCLCCKNDDITPEQRNTKISMDAKAVGFSSGLFKSTGSMSTKLPTSRKHQDIENSHYITGYLECKKWRKKVQELLPLSNNAVCKILHGELLEKPVGFSIFYA